MSEEEKNEILKIINSIPEEFRLSEDGISNNTFDEYYKQLEYLDERNFQLKEIEERWKKDNSLESLKMLLVLLSKQGDVPSYRKIENILKNEKLETKDFGFVVLNFARLNLENQLLDQSVGFISTGLGGKRNLMRFYFVFTGKNNLLKEEKEIKESLKLIQEKADSEIEEIEFNENYLLLKVLISMEVSVADWVEAFLKECHFVNEEYLCTNVEKPEKAFINSWIKDELNLEDNAKGWRMEK